MSTPTTPTAAALLSARWTPSTEPGVILAELGTERSAIGLAAIDPHRALDLSDADAARLASHVANAHNMAICTTPIIGFTPLPPEQLEQLKAMAATPGIIQAVDDHGLQAEVLRNILNAARTLPSLKGITLTSKDPMAQARWLTALGDLKKAVDEYDGTAVRVASRPVKPAQKVVAVPPENDTPVECPECGWQGRADELGPEGECGAEDACTGRPAEITDHADLIRAWTESEGTLAGPQCRDLGLIEPHPASETEAAELDLEVGDAVWDVTEKGETAIRGRGKADRG